MSTALTRRAGRLIALAAGWCVGAAVHAQPAPPADTLDLLAQENLVYSASRYVQTLAETPANVSIISSDDIRRYGYRSVADALQSLPGVYDATSQWPALGVSGTAVPGDFGSRVLYLVNGMPVYEPTYGGFFLEYLDIESIERIEFVKGAGSALYGSGAVMGIVNLITRSAKDAAGSTAALELAGDNSAKMHWSGSRQGPRVHSFVAASAAYSGGRDVYLREFDQPELGGARHHGIAAGSDSGRTGRLFARLSAGPAWLQAMLVAGSKRDPLASYGSVLGGRLMLRESLAALEGGVTHDFDSGGQLTARLFAFTATERGDYPYARNGHRGAAADYIEVSDLASRQLGAEVRYDHFFGRVHHVLGGLEIKHIGFSHQAGNQPGLHRAGAFSVDNSESFMQWALFLQDEIRVGPGKLFLGARLDSYHGFSEGVTSRLSPRIAYVQDLAPGLTAKLTYGEAYRAPTIYESRYQDGLPRASTIWANDDLRPELSRSLEALLIGQTHAGIEWRLSAFMKHLQRTPVQVLTPTYRGLSCALGPNACIQYRNSDQPQKVIGSEFDVRVRQGDAGDLYASLVLQRGRGDRSELSSSPTRQFKAGISRSLPWQNTNAALETQYISHVFGRVNASGARDFVPSYFTFDAVFNATRLPDGWRASLRVDNLFDRNYGTVASRELQPLQLVPAAGRRFGVQLQRDF